MAIYTRFGLEVEIVEVSTSGSGIIVRDVLAGDRFGYKVVDLKADGGMAEIQARIDDARKRT